MTGPWLRAGRHAERALQLPRVYHLRGQAEHDVTGRAPQLRHRQDGFAAFAVADRSEDRRPNELTN